MDLTLSNATFGSIYSFDAILIIFRKREGIQSQHTFMVKQNMVTKNIVLKICKIVEDSTETQDTIRSEWNLKL